MSTSARARITFPHLRCIACNYEPLVLRAPWWLPLLALWRRFRRQEKYTFYAAGRCPTCHTYARIAGFTSSKASVSL